jgi:protein TonB
LRASQATPPTAPANAQITPARLISRVAPEYPKKARKKGVEGVVRLHAIIGKDGTIRELSLLHGDPLLRDAALKAVRQWRYEPMRLNGDPAEFDTTIDVIFSLNR